MCKIKPTDKAPSNESATVEGDNKKVILKQVEEKPLINSDNEIILQEKPCETTPLLRNVKPETLQPKTGDDKKHKGLGLHLDLSPKKMIKSAFIDNRESMPLVKGIKNTLAFVGDSKSGFGLGKTIGVLSGERVTKASELVGGYEIVFNSLNLLSRVVTASQKTIHLIFPPKKSKLLRSNIVDVGDSWTSTGLKLGDTLSGGASTVVKTAKAFGATAWQPAVNIMGVVGGSVGIVTNSYAIGKSLIESEKHSRTERNAIKFARTHANDCDEQFYKQSNTEKINIGSKDRDEELSDIAYNIARHQSGGSKLIEAGIATISLASAGVSLALGVAALAGVSITPLAPVGWTLAGVSLAAALGYGLYRLYRANAEQTALVEIRADLKVLPSARKERNTNPNAAVDKAVKKARTKDPDFGMRVLRDRVMSTEDLSKDPNLKAFFKAFGWSDNKIQKMLEEKGKPDVIEKFLKKEFHLE